MSLRFVWISFLAILSALTLAGCGGRSGLNLGNQNNNGGFNNSNLSGTYAFTFTGNNQFGFLTVAGSFTANGSGSITGGTADVSSRSGVFTNQTVTGFYTVHSSGEGNATLNTAAGTFDIDFVLTSGNHALIIRFDGNSSASGTFDLQTPNVPLSAFAGTFAFNVFGIDAGLNPEGSAGVFTIDASGNITSGVQDTNDNGTLSTNLPIVPGALAMSAPTNGRGRLSVTAGTVRNFVYYVVNANQLNLIEVDLSPALSGTAFRQSSTAISGSFAFTVSGAASGGPFAAGGVINTDGAGNVLNSSVEDVNSSGVVTTNTPLTGTYAVAGNGRGTVTLNGTIHLVAYPSMGGVQLLEIDGNVVAAGVALQQSGPFSNASLSGNYGLNFSGVNLATEVDGVAQVLADGAGHFSGALDLNNGGALSSALALNGSNSIAANGRGTATLQSSAGTQNVVLYMVSPNRALFIETDSSLVSVGEVDHQ